MSMAETVQMSLRNSVASDIEEASSNYKDHVRKTWEPKQKYFISPKWKYLASKRVRIAAN